MKKLKPRHKRRLFWVILSAFAAMLVAIIVVPPFIKLNSIKPDLERAIYTQTGMETKIDGNINFSLLGRLNIVAHDVLLPSGKIESLQFAVPLSKVFNSASAEISGKIFIYGANLQIDTLTPPRINNKLEIRNSVISFMGKDYEIVQGQLSNGMLNGTVRTDQHKYDFDSNGDEFHIQNKNNDLNVSGHLYSDGTATGTLSIDTNDANKFFDFTEPKIHKNVKLTTDFTWNGKHGIKFANIRGGDFTGEIELFEDGHREITLMSDDIKFDISFLMRPTSVFFNTKFNINLSGSLKLENKIFKHIKIDAVGEKSRIKINQIVADDIIINGGEINVNGAENLGLNLKLYGEDAYCLFSGTPDDWNCSELKQGEFYGKASSNKNRFELYVKSDKNMPAKAILLKKLGFLGKNGYVNFKFADAAGEIDLKNSIINPHYEFVKNKTLSWLGVKLFFLPDYMNTLPGDFSWSKNDIFFETYSKNIKFVIGSDYFVITGKDIKDWFPNSDLKFLNDNMAYSISGNYKNSSISNLELKIAGHVFKGTVVGNNITLKTDLLNIDTFTNQKFIDNFDENQFLTAEPLMIPFDFGVNVSFASDMIIYNGNQFTNFVYSLKSGSSQDFSITDSMHGNLLADITKYKNKYNITLQLNKFDIPERLFSSTMPVNLENTTVTAQADLTTNGKIAYDIWNNLSGNIDMSFEGGNIIGLGVDGFYANAEKITTLNAEEILSNALEDGKSKIKKIRVTGKYNHGNFTSTQPFALSLYRADSMGRVNIENGKMHIKMNLILRGTSPSPDQINLEIMPDGKRVYSLSEIMKNFDPDFLREFSKTHEKF